MKRQSRARVALMATLAVLLSLTVTLMALELALRIGSAFWKPSAVPPASATFLDDEPSDALVAHAQARHRPLTMPDEWRREVVAVPGSSESYKWHGALHVHDQNGMRRTTPFPPKRPDTYRIMVVGDSLTYGYGVRDEDTFASILGARLRRDFRAEVLNLGVSGRQSEDIRKIIDNWLPELMPELVVYAMCLNDFLPSGVGEYPARAVWEVPLPAATKKWLTANSRILALISDLYDGALRRLHIRSDFFDDVLFNFAGYQTRFAADAARMNATVRAAGLPPIIGLVINQYPNYGGRGHRMAQIAEGHMRAAGFDVIETEDYYRRYHNRDMGVSRWEGHPNEVAHMIWAGMLERRLRGRDDLRGFRLQ